VSSKAIIAMLNKTRPIARMVLLPVRLFFWLLRARRERPCCRRAAEHGDELATVSFEGPTVARLYAK
jgi:hypothetical protein